VAAPTAGVLTNRRTRGRTAAFTCGLVLTCGLAPVVLALEPRPGEPIVVFTLRPDAPIPRAVLASGASVLWLSAGGHVAVIDGTRSDLTTELRRSGALVLAAGPMGACLPGFRRPTALTGLTPL
jgi:hypothetical protein